VGRGIVVRLWSMPNLTRPRSGGAFLYAACSQEVLKTYASLSQILISWCLVLWTFRSESERRAHRGVRCNACAHRHSWPIEELIARHKPWALVSDLWKRWRCSKCGSRDVLPFAIGR
jgi:hypothetical protein